MIYFVEAAALGTIKIGFAEDPWKRLSKIQSDCPCDVVLLAVDEGGIEKESELHHRFNASRERGEWFRYTDDLRAHVATLPSAIRPRREFKVTKLAAAVGISKPHASRILSGATPVTIPLAISIYRELGWKLGPAAIATDEDLIVLERFFRRCSEEAA